LSDVEAGVLRRAVRLADRYGLPLGPDVDAAAEELARPGPEEPDRTGAAEPPRRSWGIPDLPDRTAGRPDRTDAGLARSSDDYHGSYNDYLWLLALGDGALPDPDRSGGSDQTAPTDAISGPATAPRQGLPGPADRTIDGVLAEPNDDDQDC
jgi:hypothetical protein